MPAPTPRTTSALVEAIVDINPGLDLTPYIVAANQITTGVCTYQTPKHPCPGRPIPYTDGFIGSQMEIIERWLAAHFYGVYDALLSASRALDASVQFQFKIAYDLRNTRYGQQAIMLDFQGNLAKWNNSAGVLKRIKISMGWLGTDRRCWPGDVDFGGQWADLTICQ